MKHLSIKAFFVAATLGSALSPARAQFVAVDFNTPNDLTGKFSNNDLAGVSRYTQVATGGLADSGAVNMLNTVDANHTTAVYNQLSYDFSQSGHSITVSQFVKRQNASITQTPFIMLGILSDLNGRMDAGSASNSYASIRIDPSSASTATNVFLQTETKGSGGSRTRFNTGLAASLVPGDWYRVSGTFKMNSPTDLLISMTLEDWGTTGSAFQSTALALNPILISLTGTNLVTGDGSVWVGVRAFDEGGSNLLDNFAAAPEPMTASLLGLAALMIRYRRRSAVALTGC